MLPWVTSILSIAAFSLVLGRIVQSAIRNVVLTALATALALEAYSYIDLGYLDPFMLLSFVPVALAAAAISGTALALAAWWRARGP